jgi:hypothetical protein
MLKHDKHVLKFPLCHLLRAYAPHTTIFTKKQRGSAGIEIAITAGRAEGKQ